MKTDNLSWQEALNLLKTGLCQEVCYHYIPNRVEMWWRVVDDKITKCYPSGCAQTGTLPWRITDPFKVKS